MVEGRRSKVGVRVSRVVVSRSGFYQFEKDAVGRLGVDEGDESAVCAGPRLTVYQFDAEGVQVVEDGVEVFDFEADMVYAWASVLEKLLDGAFIAHRLKELEA
jgi:hypothetical protein